MGNEQAVHVEGLKELRRSLGQIDKQLPKNLRGRLKRVGDKIAARAAQSMPKRTGRAAGSVKAGVSGNTAYVQTGKKTVPYAAWLDFGGTLKPTGGRRNTQVRPRIPGGRYLYPAIEALRPQTEREAREAFDDTARELGLK
jgi:hypothetical protein